MNSHEPDSASPASARQDLAYLEQLLQRARQRIDTHAFHGVHWGLIVGIWYPLANYFQLSGHVPWMLPLGIIVLATDIPAAHRLKLWIEEKWHRWRGKPGS